jgi:hypothetical protein
MMQLPLVSKKDYISKAVSGTKVNILGVFNYEFPADYDCVTAHNRTTTSSTITINVAVWNCFVIKITLYWVYLCGVTRGSSWFRHWTISRKLAVSIPDGVIGSFH